MLNRLIVMILLVFALSTSGVVAQQAGAGGQQGQSGSSSNQSSGGSDATPAQRLDVMRSRLDRLRRSLSSSVAALNTKDSNLKTDDKSTEASDPRLRLRGLEQEVASVLSEVNDVRGKQERAERYDAGTLDKLESAIADLDERVQAGLRATAGDRRDTAADASTTAATADEKKKKGGGFLGLGRLFGGGGDDKYDELIGAVAPGRDRELFEVAAKDARKGNYEVARSLFNVIITTYPESVFLPLAKLAIADTFYLEGTSSALIQAGAAYQDWATFFPTDTLADDVYLKIAEAEMRQIGLPDRDVSRARKAEQRLKVLMQQFPNTALKPDVEIRLREVQENLGMHDLHVGNQYYAKYFRGNAANPKGAQSRYRDIVEKYPNFSYMDEVLYKLGVTYVQEEEPDEAAKHFQKLVREYPGSEFAEQAREQLTAIGVAIPERDLSKKELLPPPRPTFRQKLLREILGTTPVTVTKDGVLIKKDGKGDDLIELAIQNGGQLPATTPTAPVQRRAPARVLPASISPSTPSTTNRATTNSAQDVAAPTLATPNTGGLSIKSTQAGPPPVGGGTTLSPTAPVTPPPTVVGPPTTTTTTTTTEPAATTPATTPPTTTAPTTTPPARGGSTP